MPPGRLTQLFSADLAIDLGTVNTLVFLQGTGIILNESSMVAIRETDQSVIAVGRDAKAMLGRAPGSIRTMRPLTDGVMADSEVTEKILEHLISRARERHRTILRPRVLIGVPSGSTQVERRAVRSAARQAGAREVFLIEEPIAAAIGAGLPVSEPKGNLIVDIGGGMTEVAVIALAGVVHCQSLRVAGDEMDEAVIGHIRKHYNLLVGERQAEEVKIALGSACQTDDQVRTMEIKGRDLVDGLPKSVVVTDQEIREALREPVQTVIEAVHRCLEQAPPELAADIADPGIVMSGGGALLHGLDSLLSRDTGLSVTVAPDPLSCVALGAGKVLEELDLLARVAAPD